MALKTPKARFEKIDFDKYFSGKLTFLEVTNWKWAKILRSGHGAVYDIIPLQFVSPHPSDFL